jgi:hypothetical protein
MWGYTYWPWYLIIGNLAWMVPELYAVFTNVGNTLSDYAWDKLHVGLSFSHSGIHTVSWWLSLVGWVAFVVIMTAHIWWRVS